MKWLWVVMAMVAGCVDPAGNDRPDPEVAVPLVWSAVWTAMGDRGLEPPLEPCWWAIRNFDVGEYPQAELRRWKNCDFDTVRACTVSRLGGDNPKEGSYTIDLQEGLTSRQWCRILAHELIHAAQACLEFHSVNGSDWSPPWSAEAHPPFLFDDPDGNAGYPLELEVVALTEDLCVGGG